MGKDFTPLRPNGASQKQIENVYSRLRQKEVIEASNEAYFNKILPDASAILDIEIGYGSTRESIVRFKDGGFVVFKGIVKVMTILKSR
jgi:hypothetical protein